MTPPSPVANSVLYSQALQYNDPSHQGHNPRKAVRLFKKLADEAQHVGAMKHLAKLYWSGASGVGKDLKEAGILYDKAVSRGSLEARVALGEILQVGGEGVEKDVERAKRLWGSAAEEGSVKAMVLLGREMKRDGNLKKARHLYEKAVRKQDAEAMWRLAVMLKDGEGGRSDVGRAKKLLEKAVDAGEGRAMFVLARLLSKGGGDISKDLTGAVKWYERAAEESNCVWSMFNLALLYRDGVVGESMALVKAVEWFERAIEAGGDADAMEKLGRILLEGGEGVTKDVGKGVRYLEDAVEKDSVRAMLALGVLLKTGTTGVAKDSGRARRLFEKAVRRDDADAMWRLGEMLRDGEGGRRDVRRAKDLFERGAKDKNHVRCLYELGELMRDGWENVVEKDFVKARGFYENAVSKGDVNSMYQLARMCNHGEGGARDVWKAKTLFERAIKKGAHVKSMFKLAYLLSNGKDGVKKDMVAAVSLYERAVNDGRHVQSMCKLALIYRDGASGVVKDMRKAVDLFKQAISIEEDPETMFRLGRILVHGSDGIQRDVIEGCSLLEKAARNGSNVRAMFLLGELKKNGTGGVRRSVPEAARWYERAVENDDTNSCFALAMMLIDGEGVERDVSRALTLLKRAAEKGELVKAMYHIAQMLAKGTSEVSKDLPQAVRWYERAARKEDIESMYELGILLASGGLGLNVDTKRAKMWLEKAAQDGNHVKAMLGLAHLLKDGAPGVSSDVPLAFQLYTRVVKETQDPSAMYELARLLLNGVEGIEQDAVLGMEYLEQSIKKEKNVRAMYYLAKLLIKGADDVGQDVPRAVDLYKRASKHGHVDSMYELGRLLIKGKVIEMDAPSGKRWLEKAVQAEGHAKALFSLGRLFSRGAPGVKKDVLHAVKMYECAAKDGQCEDAVYNLALLFRDGENALKKDVPKAVALFKQAMDDYGDVESIFQLGRIFVNGAEGVESNVLHGKALLEKAVKKRYVRAMFHLAELLKNGANEVDVDVTRAAGLYRRAIRIGGHVPSMFSLALLLKNGTDGVERNASEAVALFKRAIDEDGDVDSMFELGCLYKNGVQGARGLERDIVQSVTYFERAIEKDDTASMFELARLLKDGTDGVEKDVIRAAKLFEMAMTAGNDDAAFQLASLLAADDIQGNPRRAVELYESNIGAKEDVGSMVSLAFLLRSGAKDLPRNIPYAIKLLQRAIDSRQRPLHMYYLSRILLSDDIGELRDLSRAKKLLEKAISESLFTPALHELAILLENDNVGIEKNLERAHDLHKLVERERASNSEEFSDLGEYAHIDLAAGEGFAVPVEHILRTEKVRPRQCFLLTLGAAGRGKTSVVRSLRGERFVNEHIQTELTMLDRFIVIPGERGINQQAVSELIENSESLFGNMTRVNDISKKAKRALQVRRGHRFGKFVDEDPIEYESVNKTIPRPQSTSIHSKNGEERVKYESVDGDNDEDRSVCSTEDEYLGNECPQNVVSGRRESDGSYSSLSLDQSPGANSGPARLFKIRDQVSRVSSETLYWNVIRKIRQALQTNRFPLRQDDVVRAFSYFNGIGRLVFFETSEEEFFVFMNPKVIVDFVREVTGPEDHIKRRLLQKDARSYKAGILSPTGLAELWAEHSPEIQNVMLDLLCSFDLLIRLHCTAPNQKDEYSIAIPSLLPSGVGNFSWGECCGESEVMAATNFDDVFPAGIVSSLVAHLYRTMCKSGLKRNILRSDAALLSVETESGERGRVLVKFQRELRRILWTVRSAEAETVLLGCMGKVERCLQGGLRGLRVRRKHFLIANCREKPEGCGGNRTVEIDIGMEWIKNGISTGFPDGLSGECVCHNVWDIGYVKEGLCVVAKKNSGADEDGVGMAIVPKPFDLFISHAGSEKENIGRPLFQKLRREKINSFLDEEVLTLGRETREELFAAILGSRVVVFILSVEFLSKKWPMRELKEAMRLKRERKKNLVLIPLFYGVSVEDCKSGQVFDNESNQHVFERNGFLDEKRQKECSTSDAKSLLKELCKCNGLRRDPKGDDKLFVSDAALHLLSTIRSSQ